MSGQPSYRLKRDASSRMFLSDGRLDYRTGEFESEVFLDVAEAGTVHFSIVADDPDCELGVTLDHRSAEQLGKALIEAADKSEKE